MFSRLMSSKPEAKGQPLELLRYDESQKKFELGEQAIAALKSIRSPVAVISVCGRARQGKSFILNQLLGQSSGFVVAPTHRPCTKGLWMWSTPVERTYGDGSKYHLVMLDTEGIDAWDQTGQYSVQIFSLAVLLSSLFVYNQMGGIDEAALDRLSLVTEMTKHIRVRAQSARSGAAANQELAEFTPSFLWLLRDFYLQLEDNGRQVSPREYLETALAAVPPTSAGAQAKNDIRESIKGLFPDRDCFALVRPMSDEGKLAHLEAVPPGQLRPEFREGLAKLVALCFSRAQPKRIGREVLTGVGLAGLVRGYVDAINGGAVPTIATAWQGVAEAECRRAAEDAEAAYRAAFNEGVEPEVAAMRVEHERALAVARKVYEEGCIGDATVKAAHSKKWTEACERMFTQVRDRRTAEASAAVERHLSSLNAKLAAAASDADATAAQVAAILRAGLNEFAGAAAGPTKWKRLLEFLQESLGGVLRQVESRGTQRVAAAMTRAREAEETVAATRLEVAKLRTMAGSSESKARALTQQLDAANKRSQEELDAERQRMLGERTTVEKRLEAEITQLQTRLAAAEGRVREAQDSAGQDKQKTASLERQLADARAQLTEQGEAKLALQRESQLSLRSKQSELDAALGELANLKASAQQNQLALQQLQDDMAVAIRERDDARAGGGPTCMDAENSDLNGGASGGVDPGCMTIQEIKQWLVERGLEEAVWTLAQRKTPRVKKTDWVALMQQAMQNS